MPSDCAFKVEASAFSSAASFAALSFNYNNSSFENLEFFSRFS